MRFTRCFSTLGCPALGLDEMFTLAAKHGLEALELRALHGTVDLPQQLHSEFGTPSALAKKLRTGGAVRILALDTSLRLFEADAKARTAFLEFVPWAEALAVPRLRVFDGAERGGSDGWNGAIETVQWWRELRAARGWKTDIMVETHDTLVTTAALQRFATAAPGVAVLWDTHHTWRRGGENPVATWRMIRPHVCHVHVKDSVSTPGGRSPFAYVLPGRGEFPMVELLRVLRQDEYRGAISLEWEKFWHPELAPLDEVLTAAAANSWW